MAHKRRTTAPQGKDTGSPRKRAQRPLQRRLRHALGYVDWLDVAVSLLVYVATDTLGGRAVLNEVFKQIAALLNP
jgi:hypothetical protein